MTGQPIDLVKRLDELHAAVVTALPPDLLDLSDIDATRSGLEALLAAFPAPPLPEDVTIEDVQVPGLDGDPDVMVRLYRPARPSGAGPAPALFWIHGGGMVLGSVDMDDLNCARRASEHGCVVASVEYRLAPEHPFPAPMNDCYAGLSWLAINADDLGVDRSRIAVGGASAGGGLAAGLALMARDKGGPSICFQLLIFPMLDHRNITPSSHMIEDPRVWNRAANIKAWSVYLGAEEEISPYASPATARDLSDLPPAYINVGQYDMFLDEDVAYAQSLLRAGVDAELHVYPGAFHGSSGFVVDAPVSQRWVVDEDAAIAAAFEGSGH